ncbi:MAG: hypothetical protein IJ623_06475 [Bacteroidales bacterium]|jgi:hypothetical protein|nr:hypothetical protein [Bacteroidales bacterium]
MKDKYLQPLSISILLSSADSILLEASGQEGFHVDPFDPGFAPEYNSPGL